MYLLDTNILSELVRPRPNTEVTRRLLALDAALRFASEITRFELRMGAMMRADSGAFWLKIEQRIIPRARWLPVDADVSVAAADMGAELRKVGQPVDWPDLMLAATARVHGLMMVTRNVRHFQRFDGLPVVNWFGTED